MENITTLQLNNPVSASFSPEEMLSFLSDSGTIDLSRVRNEMIKAEIDKVIESSHKSPITQGPDGRWRTSVYEGKKRRLIAKKSLDDLKLEVYCFYTGISKEDAFKDHTLESLYPRWLEYKRLHTNAGSYIDRIDSVWRNHYLGTDIITIPIEKLTKLSLDVWAHQLIKEHDLDRKQYYNITMIVRQELDFAVELGLIPFNPFASVKIDGKKMFRRARKKPSNTQVFSRSESSEMERLAWDDFEKRKHPKNQLTPLAMLFQFQTGLRIGEVCAVKYEDIHGDKLTVCRMYRNGSNDVVDDTKGTFGERDVYLTDKAKAIIEAAAERKKELGISNEFIFSLDDDPLSYYALKKLYPSYCDKLGIIPKSSHKARKTFISALIDAGVNLNTVRELVGHNDERTTLNCYCFDRNDEEEKKNMIQLALSS